jgi:nickel-type superoxide dismutase
MLSNLFEKLFNVQEATSHCDIPCGIYDPRDAIQAAQTVVRMTELLEELDFSNGPSASLGNSMARFVAAKEEHAKKS